MLVGGDFNIIRRQEKHNDNFNARGSFFNAITESLDWKELDLSCRQYTYIGK